MKQVCKDCRDRSVGCHGTCQKYLEAKAEHEKEAAKIRKITNDQIDADSFKIQSIASTKRRQRR